MTETPRSNYGGGTHDFRCPGCGLRGIIEDDQLHGLEPIECPKCDYRETRDWRPTHAG